MSYLKGTGDHFAGAQMSYILERKRHFKEAQMSYQIAQTSSAGI